MDETNQVSFTTHCPKGHMPVVSFRKDILERQLDAGQLEIFCYYCGTSFAAMDDEIRNLRGLLAGE